MSVIVTVPPKEGLPRTFTLFKVSNGWAIRLYRATTMIVVTPGECPIEDVHVAVDLAEAMKVIGDLSHSNYPNLPEGGQNVPGHSG